jgi:hypothetical protein
MRFLAGAVAALHCRLWSAHCSALTGVDTSAVAVVPVRPGVHRRVNALVSSRPRAAAGAWTFVELLADPDAPVRPAARVMAVGGT